MVLLMLAKLAMTETESAEMAAAQHAKDKSHNFAGTVSSTLDKDVMTEITLVAMVAQQTAKSKLDSPALLHSPPSAFQLSTLEQVWRNSA